MKQENSIWNVEARVRGMIPWYGAPSWTRLQTNNKLYPVGRVYEYVRQWGMETWTYQTRLYRVSLSGETGTQARTTVAEIELRPLYCLPPFILSAWIICVFFEPITEKSVTFSNLGLISIFCVLFKKLCHWPNSLNHGTRVSEVDKKCLPNWLLTINPSAFCV